MMGGYQITIKTALDEETKKCIQEILTKHQLTYQAGSMWKTKRSINKTDPDTFIIYKPKNNQLTAPRSWSLRIQAGRKCRL